jgi:uncharacterized protein (DUF305 family)
MINLHTIKFIRLYFFITLFLLSVDNSALNNLSPAPIIQPGAPGEASKFLDPEAAVKLASTSSSTGDLKFMNDMIIHHHQAVILSNLVSDRTNNQFIIDLAGRINVSQADEIKFMQDWLTKQDTKFVNSQHSDSQHIAHEEVHDMLGMASQKDIDTLTTLSGTEFDRLFLKLMIKHHDGAVQMVKNLRELPGSAYDPLLNEFISDVKNDQTVEIERMNNLLVDLSDDPRSGLAAGLFDAEIAIENLELVASLTKPLGFYDQKNPAGSFLQNEKDFNAAKDNESKNVKDKVKSIDSVSNDSRHPMMSFYNTDMAFRDDLLVTGSYHGFNIYLVSDNGTPHLQSSIVCPGGQGDISIVGNLLIMSVEETRGRLDCGLEGVKVDSSLDRFRGLRVFNISDVTNPMQVGAVQTCRGSHTHSVVSNRTPDNTIIVYNSGTSSVRDQDELAGCIEGNPGDTSSSLFSIDIIEIPINDPSKSRIVSSPRVFADLETGAFGGLWTGGDHGDKTQETSLTDQCHDITVFPSKNIAAGACSGNGIIFDITDILSPKRIDVVTDPGFAYWHSATFNNNGTKVLFTDEWGGGSRPRCRAWDPLNWGADAIYDIVESKLHFKSNYKMPAPQLETENCVAHNGSIIPVPGRDIFVQAWYQGGISIVDFTDSENPFEIAYFDRGPVLEDELITGGYWSVYYYEGNIYATEITRGLDVFKLLPSEHMTANEIAAAASAYPRTGPKRSFNPQHQVPMIWMPDPLLAKSYVDQLIRNNVIDGSLAEMLLKVLTQIDSSTNKSNNKRLIKQLNKITESLELTTDAKAIDTNRLNELIIALESIKLGIS